MPRLRRRHVLGGHGRVGGRRVRGLSRELAAGDGLGGGSCLCNAGFRLEAGACSACPVATFKEAVGNLSVTGAGCTLLNGCCACGANEVTLSTGSVHSDACVCQRGYENLGCAPCAIGYY